MPDHPHLHVEFFVDPVKDEIKSKEAGRPIFADVEFCRITHVGSKDFAVFPAHYPGKQTRDPVEGITFISYAEYYHEAYDFFKSGRSDAVSGTPLSEAPFLSEAERSELRALKIMTVEALASISDVVSKKIGMSAQGWKESAEAYIKRAQEGATDTRLAQINDALQKQIAELKAQLDGQGAKAPEPVAQTHAAVADDVVEGGPFDGFGKDELKAYIKDQTGAIPKGNFGLPKLLEMAAEAAPAS